MRNTKQYKTIIPVILLLLVLIIAGPGYAKKKNQQPETVTLTVKSKPSGATVVVNRVIRGQTPITLKLEKGRHLIRVSLNENWKPYIEEKTLDKSYELNVRLTPINEFSYNKGVKAFRRGDYPAARQHLTDAVKGGKVVPEAYFFLALLDEKKNDPAAMADKLLKLIKLNPPKGDYYKVYPEIHEQPHNYLVLLSHFKLGEYYRGKYQWGEAATAYKLSIPDRDRFIDSSVDATFANIRRYRKKLAENPNAPATLIQLAYLYELKGMLFQSMMAYRDGASTLFKSSPDFVKTLGDY